MYIYILMYVKFICTCMLSVSKKVDTKLIRKSKLESSWVGIQNDKQIAQKTLLIVLYGKMPNQFERNFKLKTGTETGTRTWIEIGIGRTRIRKQPQKQTNNQSILQSIKYVSIINTMFKHMYVFTFILYRWYEIWQCQFAVRNSSSVAFALTLTLSRSLAWCIAQVCWWKWQLVMQTDCQPNYVAL